MLYFLLCLFQSESRKWKDFSINNVKVCTHYIESLMISEDVNIFISLTKIIKNENKNI